MVVYSDLQRQTCIVEGSEYISFVPHWSQRFGYIWSSFIIESHHSESYEWITSTARAEDVLVSDLQIPRLNNVDNKLVRVLLLSLVGVDVQQGIILACLDIINLAQDGSREYQSYM